MAVNKSDLTPQEQRLAEYVLDETRDIIREEIAKALAKAETAEKTEK